MAGEEWVAQDESKSSIAIPNFSLVKKSSIKRNKEDVPS
jgi:hypothetical protein